MRRYKSGTKWCVWRWTDVRTGYIDRLHVVKTPWFAVCVHWLRTPDPDRHLHDHPVSFLSLVLRGAYLELRPTETPGVRELRARRWWNFVRATDQHRIIHVMPRTVTLCFMGPKTQEWGFYVGQLGKFTWREYYRMKELGLLE